LFWIMGLIHMVRCLATGRHTWMPSGPYSRDLRKVWVCRGCSERRMSPPYGYLLVGGDL
jgi:hypothetical protein